MKRKHIRISDCKIRNIIFMLQIFRYKIYYLWKNHTIIEKKRIFKEVRGKRLVDEG